MNFAVYTSRTIAFLIGTALAGVGMDASYVAAAKVGNEYLMIAAPLVALAAPVCAIFAELAVHSRQYFKAFVLALVFALTAATVFYTAVERNHDGRAVGEAQRLASRTNAERAERDLTEAKADAKAATIEANKTRGLDKDHCKKVCLSARASETAAIARVAAAEQAVRDASTHAVTDSSLQQADWLMPTAVDVAGTAFFWLAFGLGAVERKPAAPVQVPVVETVKPAGRKPRKPVDPVKSERAKRSAATRRANKLKSAALASGAVVAMK